MINIDERRLHWLAGLLEGEASFLSIPPNTKNGPRPAIKLVMKDEDIVQQVGDLFQVAVQAIPPRQKNWSITYLAFLRGGRAFQFMHVLHPLMGRRRQAQIQAATANYEFTPKRVGSKNEAAKLNEAQVLQIKQRIANGETAKSIARDFEVTHYTIWAIRSGKTWQHVSLDQSNQVGADESTIKIASTASDYEKQLYWLAGLLEGEGSFIAPPPSAPNRPAIQVSMTDDDIINRVGRIFEIKPHRWKRSNSRHKASYQVALRGSRAVELMRELYPLLGLRRQLQIDTALSNYTKPDQSGEKNNRAKLNTSQVIAIKTRLSEGEKPQQIAADFNVSPYTILDIKLGRTWRQVEP